MKPWAWIAIIAVILIGVWAWYGSTHWVPDNQAATTQTTTTNAAASSTTAQGSGTGTSTNPQGSSAYSSGNLLLGLNSSASVGQFLVASNAMTLYTYSKDSNGVSNCTGACATNWPPYTVTDTSVLANLEAGVGGKAGTITRADGTMQVTYNGMPLYFYKGDVSPNDTNGEGLSSGAWMVAKP